MKEIWKDILGYEGKYQVSNQGRIKSLNYNNTSQERVMRLISTKDGYLQVGLHKDGKRKNHLVHRLVAQTFIENPSGKPCIDHINTIKTDNRVDNLRWATCKENNNNPLTKEYFTENPKGAKKVFCENAIYISATQCAKHYNVNRQTMYKWLTGTCKMPAYFQAKGLKYYIE